MFNSFYRIHISQHYAEILSQASRIFGLEVNANKTEYERWMLKIPELILLCASNMI
jgi:hypothetical protein